MYTRKQQHARKEKIALTFRLVPKQKCEVNIDYIFSLEHAKFMRNGSGFL
jgi:hypothetical protein